MKKLISSVLVLFLALSLLPSMALAADKTLNLTEDWRLTSDFDLSVGSGDILTINGIGKYYIYEMGGKLKNTGTGYVRFINTVLYPASGTPTAGSLAALIATANGVTSISAPAKDATALTLPTVAGFTVSIKSSSNTGVISTSGLVTPPASATTVTLVLTLSGNGGMADTGNIQVTVPAKTQSGGSTSSGSGGGSGGGDSSVPATPPTVDGDTVSPKVTTDSETGVASANISASEIKSALATAQSEAKTQGADPVVNIIIPTATNVATIEATIAGAAFGEISSAENISLALSAGDIILTFDNRALAGINSVGSGDVKISAGVADVSALTDAQKNEVGDRPVYDFTITKGGKNIRDVGGDVTVSIPYSPKTGENPNAIVIYYVAADGELQMIENGVYDPLTGKVTFATNHFSFYMVGYNLVTFADVTAAHWGKTAIEQSAARGMVTGVGGGIYQPDRAITKAEFTQMIYNVLKLYDTNSGSPSYDDVQPGAWHSRAVSLSKSAGLFNGLILTGNNFEPDKIITREEMAVILANAVKYKKITLPKTTVHLNEKYTDYKSITASYRDEIETVVNLKVMSGISGTEFSPLSETTRGQAAQVQMNLLKVLGAK